MRYGYLIVALSLLVGCTTLPTESYQDEILGTWRTPDGKGEKTYFSDGSACGWFYSGFEPDDPNYRYTFSSTWKIEGNKLISSVVTSDNADLLPGTTITDIIESMSQGEYSFHSADWPDSEKRFKVTPGKEKHPCKPQV